MRAGQTRAEVHAWGEDCGPRPADRAEAAGATYQLDAEGRLRPEGRATALFAPGVCRQATGLAALTEQIQGDLGRCTSADPARKVEGHLTLASADRNALEVRHRFHYDWVFRGQRCQVDLSSTWQLARVQPLPPAERCSQPGIAVALEPVGASRRRVRPGAAVGLEVRARDAAGCAAAAAVAWTASHGAVDADGRWRALEVPSGTRVSVEARAGAAAHTFVLEVVGVRPAAAAAVATVDTDELLPDEPGAPTAPAPTLPELTTVGFETHADPAPTPRRWGTLLVGLFVAFGLLATLLALWIALSAWRLRRRTLAETAAGLGAPTPTPIDPRRGDGQAAPRERPPTAAQRADARPAAAPGAGSKGAQGPAAGAARPAPSAAGPTPARPVAAPRGPSAADRPPAAGAPPVSVAPARARTPPPAEADQTTQTRQVPAPTGAETGPSEPPTEPPAALDPPTVTGEHPLPVRGPRACPTCHRCFDDTSRFCPYDATPLELLDGPTLEAETARICPRCASVFPASATHCGHDGSPLLAAGHNTQPVPALRARICPQCSTHYPLDATFCGLDGAPLVLLN